MNWYLRRQRRVDVPTRATMRAAHNRLHTIVHDYTLDDSVVRDELAVIVGLLTQVERYLVDPQLVWRQSND